VLDLLVQRVVVCDRRGESRRGNKGNQVDADALSERLRRGSLRAVYHASAQRATLKELTRAYQNLVEDATRVMLRLKARFRARGIPRPGRGSIIPRSGRSGWTGSPIRERGEYSVTRLERIPQRAVGTPC